MDIIKLAKECGVYFISDQRIVSDKELQAFANAIIEECAKVSLVVANKHYDKADNSTDIHEIMYDKSIAWQLSIVTAEIRKLKVCE